MAATAVLTAGSAWAQTGDAHNPATQGMTHPDSDKSNRHDTGNMEDARKQVSEAAKVVSQMKRDPQAAKLLQQAHGVFIVPGYAKAAAIVGGRGGGGVVLVNRDGKWSNPAFFNIGGVSIGAQAGVAAGSIAMLLMDDKAVEMFKNQANNFSLNADAGLTIVNYSATAQGSYGKGDVIVWSDTEGAFAGAAIGVSDVNRDEDENHAYYGKRVSAKQILTGEVTEMHGNPARCALDARCIVGVGVDLGEIASIEAPARLLRQPVIKGAIEANRCYRDVRLTAGLGVCEDTSGPARISIC